MIFLSHTYKDKPIIDPIAQTFAKVFGTENVFYDSWSIQPGDGIIDRMSDGLSKCTHFFFFVSKNSLESKMVQLEWQNALMNSSNNKGIKFIPVKLDDCLMPMILLQTLYIDVFGKGLEMAMRQMIDVVQGRNTYVPDPGLQTYENIRGYVEGNNENDVTIIIKAESYAEPISRFLVLLDDGEGDIEYSCPTDNMYTNSFNENVQLNNGVMTNAIYIAVSRSTTPGFPVKVNIKNKNGVPLKLKGLMRADTEENFRIIPMISSSEIIS